MNAALTKATALKLCMNTNGSYICSCQSGYLLGANNQSCNGKSGFDPLLEIIQASNAL